MSESLGVPSPRANDRINRIDDEIQPISKIDDMGDGSVVEEGSSNTVVDIDVVTTKRKRSPSIHRKLL